MKRNFNFIDRKKIEFKNQQIKEFKVNFLAGTISPARSNPITQELESLDLAIQHYSKRNIENLIIQVKHMGSRCNLYIFEDIDQCYAISKSGFKINKPELQSIFKERIDFWKKDFNNNLRLIIEDGELLPCSLLSDEDIITKDFHRYSFLENQRIDRLKELGFYSKVSSLLYNSNLKASEIETLFNILDYSTNKQYIEEFNHQIAIFSKQQKVEFKPFNILKKVSKDNTEEILHRKNYENYRLLSPEYVVINSKDYKNYQPFIDFMKWIENNEYEGIVIKPCEYIEDQSVKLKAAPYLKVRNKKYLRIVYGIDYTHKPKYQNLIQKKSVGKKIGVSIKEWNIGEALLNIRYINIEKGQVNLKSIIKQHLKNQEFLSTLDPRL